MRDDDDLAYLRTTGRFPVMPGNALFEATVLAIGFDDAVARRMLTIVAHAIGSNPGALSPDELGLMLPELERRLRELAPGTRVDDSMRAVQHLLIGWEAPAEPEAESQD